MCGTSGSCVVCIGGCGKYAVERKVMKPEKWHGLGSCVAEFPAVSTRASRVLRTPLDTRGGRTGWESLGQVPIPPSLSYTDHFRFYLFYVLGLLEHLD
jgi:hypothetical protein